MKPSPAAHERPSAGPPAALRLYSRTVEGVCQIAGGLAAAGLLVSTALIGWAVGMRYGLNQAPIWVDDVVGFILVGIVMTSAAPALRRGDHIGVDLLTERLSGGASRVAKGWYALATLAVSVILCINGWQAAMQSRQFGIVTEGGVEWPIWMLMLLMPLGGLLLTAVSIELLWRVATGHPLASQHHLEDTP